MQQYVHQVRTMLFGLLQIGDEQARSMFSVKRCAFVKSFVLYAQATVRPGDRVCVFA